MNCRACGTVAVSNVGSGENDAGVVNGDIVIKIILHRIISVVCFSSAVSKLWILSTHDDELIIATGAGNFSCPLWRWEVMTAVVAM